MSLGPGDLRNAECLLRAALVAKHRAGGSPVDTGRTLCVLAETTLTTARDVIALAGPPAEDPRTYGLVGARYSVILHAADDRTGAADVLHRTLPIMLATSGANATTPRPCWRPTQLLLAPRDPTAAARLLGAAGALRRDVGRPASEATAAVAVRAVGQCRASLGRAEHALGHDEGTTMTAEELVAVLEHALR